MTGKQLRELRERKGYTVPDVALRTGLTAGAVRWAENQTTLIRLHDRTAREYARIYDTTPENIRAVTGEGSK